jgi:predicted SnoaL-like aldol condensation-catalyzing enzyme
MKRFITLASIALIVAALVKQRQRVSELGRQALSGRTTPDQWQRVQGLTRRVLSRDTEETSVSVEENKAVARRWFEDLFNAGILEVADEIIAADHVNHDPPLPDIPTGPEGQKQVVNLYGGAFTNAHISIEDQIAEGDRVATRWTGSGTHQGEFMGVAPTGNQVTVTGITINRISGGKIVESWTNYDALGMMQQIGAVPEPGQGES